MTRKRFWLAVNLVLLASIVISFAFDRHLKIKALEEWQEAEICEHLDELAIIAPL